MDPIADLLTRIRNGTRAELRFVDIPWSRMKESIVKLLIEQGYVAHYLVKEEKKKHSMRIFLKYGPSRTSVIQGLKRISKPSLRKYVSHREIPNVMGGLGIVVVSTSQGVLEGTQAREKRVGGELICTVW